MKIQSLYFKNGKLGWEVKPIKFQNLNLLVGLSGAGKSQIIRALWYLWYEQRDSFCYKRHYC